MDFVVSCSQSANGVRLNVAPGGLTSGTTEKRGRFRITIPGAAAEHLALLEQTCIRGIRRLSSFSRTRPGDHKEDCKAGHLTPYKFAEGITELIAEGAEVDGETYDPEAFERNWTNEDTNRKMMVEFDRLAWSNYKDSAPLQKHGPGKAIVFAITKRHAARLAQYLNELHSEHQGRYAEVITSDVADADPLIQNFKKEIYPMVAVSVDMLTTGFDCPEVLHVVMCRRIFSPILYQQIRGRGTRTAPRIAKTQFVIYDYFRNHQYFQDDGADISGGTGGGGGRQKPPGPPTRRWWWTATLMSVAPASPATPFSSDDQASVTSKRSTFPGNRRLAR